MNGRNDLPAPTSTCIDWFSEGETRVVEVDGVRVLVRFVGRKGRRGRIVIEAPAGAAFSSDAATTKAAASDDAMPRSMCPKETTAGSVLSPRTVRPSRFKS
jgi:hypothetical protein